MICDGNCSFQMILCGINKACPWRPCWHISVFYLWCTWILHCWPFWCCDRNIDIHTISIMICYLFDRQNYVVMLIIIVGSKWHHALGDLFSEQFCGHGYNHWTVKGIAISEIHFTLITQILMLACTSVKIDLIKEKLVIHRRDFVRFELKESFSWISYIATISHGLWLQSEQIEWFAYDQMWLVKGMVFMLSL